MKEKFYSTRLLAFVVFVILSHTAHSQDVYFREGFGLGSGGWPSSLAEVFPSTTVTEGVFVKGSDDLVWYDRGVFRSAGPTGTCISQTGDAYHARFANMNNSNGNNAADSAFLVTPVVDFGIGTITYYNGRASRRFTIYKTSDTAANTSNWTFVVNYPTTNSACDFFSTVINDASAKRLKIYSRSTTDSDADSIVMTSATPILPVIFKGVSAATVNGFSKLTWNIATEYNTRAYLVEKSTDGINFKSIAEVPATNAGTYNYIDQSTLNGTAYYRVKALDKDGKQVFSGVIRLSSALQKPAFLITPNVITGRALNLQLTNIEKGNIMVRVSNNMGQIVYASSLMNEGGSVSKQIQLPSSLTTGTYRVQLVTGSTVLTQTAIIQ